MQTARIFRQLGAQPGGLLGLLRVDRGFLRASGFGGGAQLLEHVFFAGFVGMKFEAERVEPQLAQALLHDRQRRHLLGDEEHSLAPRQRVDDQSRDGLRLTGAGRPVQHERFARHGRLDGVELRRVHRQRQQQSGLIEFPRRLHGRGFPAQFAVHQASHDFVLFEIVHAVADIVPHHEAREREDAHEGRLDHVPAFLLHHGAAHGGEDAHDVGAVFVGRQRVESVDDDAEVLLEHLQQRHVHDRLLVAQAQTVAFVGGLAHQLRRQQDQRRVARAFAALGFVPAQQSHRQIQAVGAVFFDRHFGGAVQFFDGSLQLSLAHQRAQPPVLVLRLQQSAGKRQLGRRFQAACRPLGQTPLLRARRDGELPSVGKRVFELRQRRGQHGDQILGGAQVEQRVAQPQIEQLAFPLQDFLSARVQRFLRRRLSGAFRDARRHFFRRGGQLRGGTRLGLHAPALIGPHAQRQRPDSRQAGSVHVDDITHWIVVAHLRRGGGAGFVEGHSFSGGGAGALHHGDLADAVGHAFAHQSRIVLDRVLKSHFFQPDAGENMIVLEQKQRIQSRRLEAGRVEQRQVKTGAQARSRHRVAEAHALPRRLETGRRHGVDDVQLLNRAVQSGRLPEHAVGILRLIGVERRAARPFFQQLRSALHESGDLGMVGGDEGRQQLGIVAASLPLVEGQEGHFFHRGSQTFLSLPYFRRERRDDALRQLRETLGPERNFEVADLRGLARREPGDSELGRLDKIFRREKAHFQIFQIRVAVIAHGDAARQRQAVLLLRIVDDGRQLHVQCDCRGSFVHGALLARQ